MRGNWRDDPEEPYVPFPALTYMTAHEYRTPVQGSRHPLWPLVPKCTCGTYIKRQNTNTPKKKKKEQIPLSILSTSLENPTEPRKSDQHLDRTSLAS